MTDDPRARVAEYESALLDEITRRILGGNVAVGLAVADPDHHVGEADVLSGWNVSTDDAVEAAVTIGDDTEERTFRAPLTDVPRLAEGGVLRDVRSPGKTPVWLATAVDPDGRVITVRDAGGIGHLAASRAPGPDGKSLGAFAARFWTRSGVPAVNERRADAVQALVAEYGNAPPDRRASRIVLGARLEAAITYFAAAPSVWVVLRPDAGTIEAPEPAHRRSVADAIVAALSTEAFGASRRSLPAARGWEVKWAETYDTDTEGRPYPAIVYEADLAGNAMAGAVTGRATDAQLVSTWTLVQSGPDPTGTVAAAAVDGTLSVAGDADAAAESVAAWRRAGLTERQIVCLGMYQLGFSTREIGAAVQRHRSVVSRELRAARRRLL